MFPIDQLTRFQVTREKYKLVKPWWDVCTGYLTAVMLILAVLSGAIWAAKGSLVCLPYVDCTLNSSVNSSICEGHSTEKEMLIQLPDRRQYDYFDAECGNTAIHWFASYFPLFIFVQAAIFIIVDNLWMILPQTSSIIDHFVSLVSECYDAPGTTRAVSHALWGTYNHENDDPENPPDLQQSNCYELLPTHQTPESEITATDAIKLKDLYEKVGRFREDVKRDNNNIVAHVYFWLKVVVQLVLAITFIVISSFGYPTLKNVEQCTTKYYSFNCTNVLAAYFHVILIINIVVIVFYSIFFGSAFVSMACNLHAFLPCMKETELFGISTSAEKNLVFLLYLLDRYNKLYHIRFHLFLSVRAHQDKNIVVDYILNKKWPLEKLTRKAEDNWRRLELKDLNGIPKTLFEMTVLDSLMLTNCTFREDKLDFKPDDWRKLRLRSLSLVNCGLRSFPLAILEMHSLETLDLSGNKIHQLDSEVFWQLITMKNLMDVKLVRNNKSLNLSLPEPPGQQRITLKRLQIDEDVAKSIDDTRGLLKNIIQYSTVIKYSKGMENVPRPDSQEVYPMMSKGAAPDSQEVYPMMSKGAAHICFDRNNYNDILMGDKVNALFNTKGIGYYSSKTNDSQESSDSLDYFLRQSEGVNEQCNSVVLVIICTFTNEGLKFSDGMIKTVESIVSRLNCVNLIGKPKLIFIQANPDASLHLGPHDESELEVTIPPDCPDMLIAYSKVPDSGFISTLVEVFSKYACQTEVPDLLKYVNYEMALKSGRYKGILEIQSTLTKKLYFFPGYHTDNRN